MASCVRCGKETRGTYCMACRGWQESVKALLATAEDDARLLALSETMTNAGLARSLSVSRAAIGQRLQRARERQKRRAALEIELTGIEEAE